MEIFLRVTIFNSQIFLAGVLKSRISIKSLGKMPWRRIFEIQNFSKILAPAVNSNSFHFLREIFNFGSRQNFDLAELEVGSADVTPADDSWPISDNLTMSLS